jgi:hypothetical protein
MVHRVPLRFLKVALPMLVAGSAAAAPGTGIPPGQDEQILRMLGRGAELPGDCRLADVAVDAERLLARYGCGRPARTVTIALHPPAPAREGALRTTRFQLLPVGEAPPGLVAAVAERVREGESGFRWRPGGATAARAHLALLLPALAWLVVVVGGLVLAASAGPLLRRRRVDALCAGALFAVALAARLALAPGPLDFAEAERLGPAWGELPWVPPHVALTELLVGLRRLGVPIATLLDGAGPVLGALGVAFTYALARTAGLSPSGALCAGAILLGWPAHLRYSATPGLPVIGPTIATAVLALAGMRPVAPSLRLPLIAAGALLAAASRPEMALLALALLPLLAGSDFSRRQRLVLGALLLLVAAPYPLLAGADSGAERYDARVGAQVARLLFTPSVSPTWWVLAGGLGLLCGKMHARFRVGLLLLAAALMAVYVRLGSETNPLWGLWRYLVALAPLLSVGAAALLARIPRAPLAALAALALASAAVYVPVVRRPLDLQVEYHYLRHSAERIAREHPDLLVLGGADSAGSDGTMRFETLPAMALAAALGTAGLPARCGDPLPTGGPRLWSLDALAGGCLGDLRRAALYLGLHRPSPLPAALAGYRLEPIEERTVRAAPAAPVVDDQCPPYRGVLLAGALPDCSVRLGWYRLAPRDAPAAR